MEAFPAIILLTANPVLATAIPAQLSHVQNEICNIVENWQQFEAVLSPTPPSLALLDCHACDAQLEGLNALHQAHPLMALLGIGTAEQAQYFDALPLSGFALRPVAMPALLHTIEHLLYARAITAGNQALPFGQHCQFYPAEKLLAYTNQKLELTDKESAILLCLYHHRHGWLARQQFLEEVWGYSDAVTTHTLETHLYRLRMKLREIFETDEIIVTHQGAYRLNI
ncbi:MAG: winged helix-turn-helix domain-containing protein [Alphaproteobacteria bacterium]|nr:winged helix-turn-helix domain-containing protein [Alphaproteobacteria bacterium]